METKFNFKSAICTSRKQSEKLLALGLKPETVDMCYKVATHDWRGHEIPEKDRRYSLCGWYDESNIVCGFEQVKTIPAWSLDRLREMLNKSGVTISFVERDTSIIVERYGVFQNVCEIWDNVYDNICDAIEWLIKEGYFNKEYLEE